MGEERYIKFYSPALHNVVNLARKRISCSSPTLFNDPIDCYVIRNEETLRQFEDEKLRELLRKIRICSLAKLDDNKKDFDKLSVQERLMWAHYGQSHEGFAVEYDLSSFKGLPEEYEDFKEGNSALSDAKYTEDLINNIDNIIPEIDQENLQLVLEDTIFVKDKAFEYEKEARIVTLSEDKFSYIDIPPLKKIVFGIYCEESLEEAIKNIVSKIYNEKIIYSKINNKMKEELYD